MEAKAKRAKREVITQRDVEVLVSLYKYKYLSRTQVQRLHFPSQQTANRRLRALTQGGHVTPFQPPGVGERLFALSKRGAELVAEILLVPLNQLKWSPASTTPKDYYFTRHFLEANDFRISLTRACQENGEISLMGYMPEYYGEKTEKGGMAKYIRDVISDVQAPQEKLYHTPDSVFALEKNGKRALFFLEIDRGTEVLTNPEKGFLKMVRFYLNYLLEKGYKRYEKEFGAQEFRAFRVLLVTNSQDRLQNMRQVGSKFEFQSEHAKRFFWLCIKDKINEGNIFKKIWAPLDEGDENLYGIS